MKPRSIVTTALTLLALARTTPALAAPPAPAPPPAVRAEASARFDRAIALSDRGDHAGALAEFKRAYELLPNRLVLTNIGLVYAALDRPVEATDALDRALAQQGELPADLLARARKVRREQGERIGFLAITANVAASIDVNGVDVGRTPLAPVRVASGTLLVGAAAPGRLPSRREVTVAGGTTVPLAFELLPTASALAHLTLITDLPGCEVLVDGEPVARTPLSAALALPPGSHTVELRRPGYQSVARTVTLPEGGRSELALRLEEATGAGAGDHGQLELAASEPGATLTLDGQPHGELPVTLTVPVGPHSAKIERPGFLTQSRELVVAVGRPTRFSAELVPTAETRLAYVESAQLQRKWAGIAFISGAALAVVGGGVAIWGHASLPAARDKLLSEEEAQSFGTGSGPCDPATGPPDDLRPMCEKRLRDARNTVSQRKLARTIGVAGVAVGLAAAGVGMYLRFSGDDPAKYDRLTGGTKVEPWLAAGVGGVVLRGGF